MNQTFQSQVLRVKDQGAAQKAAQRRTDFESGTRREAASVERTAKGGGKSLNKNYSRNHEQIWTNCS